MLSSQLAGAGLLGVDAASISLRAGDGGAAGQCPTPGGAAGPGPGASGSSGVTKPQRPPNSSIVARRRATNTSNGNWNLNVRVCSIQFKLVSLSTEFMYTFVEFSST